MLCFRQSIFLYPASFRGRQRRRFVVRTKNSPPDCFLNARTVLKEIKYKFNRNYNNYIRKHSIDGLFLPGKPTVCVLSVKIVLHCMQKEGFHEPIENRKIYCRVQKIEKSDANASRRKAKYYRQSHIKVGKRHFNARFCDYAGAL